MLSRKPKIKEIMGELSKAELFVLFNREGKILKSNIAKRKAKRVINKSFQLLNNVNNITSNKYDSEVKLRTIRGRGDERYFYVLDGGSHILTLLQKVPMSNSEEETIEALKQLKQVLE